MAYFSPHSLALAGLVLCGASQAQTPSNAVGLPWTPTLQTRNDLHFLADVAMLPLPVGHWPQPTSAVREALSILPSLAAPGVQAAHDRVLRELDIAEGAQLQVTLRNKAETLSGFGEPASPGSSASVRSPRFANEWFAAQLGLHVDQTPDQALQRFQNSNNTSLQGSAAAVRVLGWNLQANTTPRWWGVGWQASLVQSHNAPAMVALGLQRTEVRPPQWSWLSWMGPWSFDGFVGQMENHITPEDPLLLGARLTFKPTPRWEFGLTKNTQTAGKGRPSGLKDLLRALVSAGGNQEVGPAARAQLDSGNTVAGFDVRYRCALDARCAFYSQWMGEDEAGNLPSKHLTLWGAEFWNAANTQRYFVEYADSHCNGIPGATVIKPCAYLNGAYAQGFTTSNRWLGASQGPDSRIVSVGWLDAQSRQALRLSAGNIGSQLGNFVPGAAQAGRGSLWALSWQREWQLGRASLTPELTYTRFNAAGPDFKNLRAGLSVRLPLSF